MQFFFYSWLHSYIHSYITWMPRCWKCLLLQSLPNVRQCYAYLVIIGIVLLAGGVGGVLLGGWCSFKRRGNVAMWQCGNVASHSSHKWELGRLKKSPFFVLSSLKTHLTLWTLFPWKYWYVWIRFDIYALANYNRRPIRDYPQRCRIQHFKIYHLNLRAPPAFKPLL